MKQGNVKNNIVYTRAAMQSSFLRSIFNFHQEKQCQGPQNSEFQKNILCYSLNGLCKMFFITVLQQALLYHLKIVFGKACTFNYVCSRKINTCGINYSQNSFYHDHNHGQL
jgi:hypothetical protein